MTTKKIPERIKVWDLPTRVFHWSLVSAIVAAWVTKGSSQQLDIHVFAGYLAAALVVFRLLWGWRGGKYARFRSFIYTPAAYRDHLRNLIRLKPARHVGHNPLGGLAIFLILGLLAFIVSSGMLALGGAFQQGPMAGYFSFALGDGFREAHEFLANSLAAVIALHIGGVVAESILTRDNLFTAMVHGLKSGYSNRLAASPFTTLGITLTVMLSIATGVYFLPYFLRSPQHPYQPFPSPHLVSNPAWDKECSDCHLSYHPSILPARSWKKLFMEQDQHFGEDLALDNETTHALLQYALINSAENHQTRAAWKIDRSIPQGALPLRVTETRFWERAHGKLKEAVWKMETVKSKANCQACHTDAASGGFQPAAMIIPPPILTTPRAPHDLIARLNEFNPFSRHRTESQQ